MSTVSTQILNDGARNATIKFSIVADITELTDALLVDVSALSGSFTEVKILGIQAGLEGFGAQLLWDATVNVAALDIPATEDFDQEYRKFGGLINNAGAGKTGNILISTSGAAVGLTGTGILELRKRG